MLTLASGPPSLMLSCRLMDCLVIEGLVVLRVDGVYRGRRKMMRDLDAEYDELVDELEKAVQENDPAKRGDRIRVVRLQIQDLLREQMDLAARLQPLDQRRWP